MRSDRTKQTARASLAQLQAYADQLPRQHRADYLRALHRFRRATTAAAVAAEQARESKRRAQRRQQLMPALAARRSKSEISDADVAAQFEQFKLKRPIALQRWSAWRIAGEIIDAVNAARAAAGRAALARHTVYDKVLWLSGHRR